MDKWPKFGNAPIVEAILDIRTTPDPKIDLSRLTALNDSLIAEYPTVSERFSVRGEFQFSREGSISAQSSQGGPDGYLLRSRDGKHAVQFRLDGFTFSRLRPYESWETFFASAWSLWERYREVTAPQSITRIGLRYINRLMLPLPFKDFKEFVLTTPEIAPTLPQGLAGFLLRLVVPCESHDCVVVMTETTDKLEDNALPFILDIDAFRDTDLSPDDPGLVVGFNELRQAKNDFFFESLTERAKELFK